MKPTIIIDNGTYEMKAGFSFKQQEENILPEIIFKTQDFIDYVSQQNNRHDSRISSSSTPNTPHDNNTYDKKETRTEPIRNGVITDWEQMEKIWHHIFDQELQIEPREYPVLLSESGMNQSSTSTRRRMAQIMFETFQIPSIYVGVNAELIAYSSGREECVVLDAGGGGMYTVPVYEGEACLQAAHRLKIGGEFLSKQLKRKISILNNKNNNNNNNHLNNNNNTEIEKEKKLKLKNENIDELKHELCFVSLNYESETNLNENLFHSNSNDTTNRETDTLYFELPDGTPLSMDRKEQFRIPELLFRPQLITRHPSVKNVPEQVLHSIMDCDIDRRMAVANAIVIGGGVSMMKGFVDRFENEFAAIKPSWIRNDMEVDASPDRMSATWTGGSVLSQLSVFKDLLTSKEQYEEIGDSLFC